MRGRLPRRGHGPAFAPSSRGGTDGRIRGGVGRAWLRNRGRFVRSWSGEGRGRCGGLGLRRWPEGRRSLGWMGRRRQDRRVAARHSRLHVLGDEGHDRHVRAPARRPWPRRPRRAGGHLLARVRAERQRARHRPHGARPPGRTTPSEVGQLGTRDEHRRCRAGQAVRLGDHDDRHGDRHAAVGARDALRVPRW